MRLSGTLRSWNDERGFGFIAPTHGGAELFVHISALPRDGSRPAVGEKVTYVVGNGRDGRLQALNVQRDAIGHPRARPRPAIGVRKSRRSFGGKGVGLLVLVALAAYGFRAHVSDAPRDQTDVGSSALQASPESAPVGESSSFRCDGRTHCSQMTSCAEAKYFLNNCPGTQMDGNHDGTPCEQQWCTSQFSK
jgi:cold shock CspA family protein